MLFYIILTLFLISVKGQIRYDDYKVFSVIPESEYQVQALEDLKQEILYEFWNDLVGVGKEVRIMVAPDRVEDFQKGLLAIGLNANLQIDNVQHLIDRQLKRPQNGRNTDSFGWTDYHTLDEIYEWLDELAETYPDVVTVVTIGRSNEQRVIKGVKIDFKQKGNESVIAMIEGGIHAREWISPATVTWLINEFLTSTESEIRFLAEALVWHLFPVTNPDGYVYTFTHNRMWRKNRNVNFNTSCASNDDLSNGIDLNRNFAFHWMEIGASLNPCAETFAGPQPFSEPESRAIANYVLSIRQEGKFIYYISFHSFGQMVLVPYSHVSGVDVLQVENYGNLYEIAIRGMDKLKERFGTEYTVGTSQEILYAVSGSSFDWIKGVVEVPIVYLLELRDSGSYGFLLPPELIIPNNLEVMDGLIEMDRVTRRLGYYTGSAIATATISLLMFYAAALLCFIM